MQRLSAISNAMQTLPVNIGISSIDGTFGFSHRFGMRFAVQPNVCIVSEEVEAKNQTLDDIVTYIAQVVADRAADGNNFGTVLIPEGLIEFIPAMKALIAELNDLLATPEGAALAKDQQREWILNKLSAANKVYTNLFLWE